MNNFNENVCQAIGEQFPDLEIQSITVDKVNEKKEGICFKKKGSNIGCNIYTDAFAGQVESGELTFDEAVAQIADGISQTLAKPMPDISFLNGTWEDVKGLVGTKAVNFDRNKDMIADKHFICDVIEGTDIGILYTIKLDLNENGTGTVTFTSELADRYGVTVDDVRRAARVNSQKDVAVSDMLSMLTGIIAHHEDGEENASLEDMVDNLSDISEGFYVVTNRNKVNGAGAAFYSGVLQLLAERFGDLYVLPSSLHEILVLPATIAPPDAAEELAKMVKDVNRTVVEAGDWLSDNAFFYAKEDEKLSPVAA